MTGLGSSLQTSNDTLSRSSDSVYLLGEGRVLQSEAKPAFTLQTLQPLRDMRHFEQPSLTALPPPGAVVPSFSSSSGTQPLLTAPAPCSCRHMALLQCTFQDLLTLLLTLLGCKHECVCGRLRRRMEEAAGGPGCYGGVLLCKGLPCWQETLVLALAMPAWALPHARASRQVFSSRT